MIAAEMEFVPVDVAAPLPAGRDGWTADVLVLHHAARAAAHFSAARHCCMVDPLGVHRNVEAGLAHLGLASLLDRIQRVGGDLLADTVEDLWSITPERGALNGEWEDWADALLVSRGGPNAVDIAPEDHDLSAEVSR